MNAFSLEHIKQLLADKSALGLKLLFIFMVVYTVMTGGDHRNIKLFLVAACLFVVVFFVKKITQPLLWYIFLAILMSDLISDYFVRANHHFFLIYLNVLIIIYLHNARLDILVTNIKLVVVIVLLFSGIQKLVSPQFVSGDFYYYMINTGSFFKPLLYLNPYMEDIVISNKAQIAELALTDPMLAQSITLQNILPNLDLISKMLAWTTILMELIAAILLLWKPRNPWTHIIFICLVIGIFLTRLENGFLALLAISGVWMSMNARIRAVYALLAMISLAFVITKVGFY